MYLYNFCYLIRYYELDGGNLCWCLSSTYYYQGNCYANCPDGYWNNPATRYCDTCYSICATCFGPNYNECRSCKAGYTLDPSGTRCICETGYFQSPGSTVCLSNCLALTYPNTTTYNCEDCSLKCAICSGPNDNQCTACRGTNYLYGTTCYANNCPDVTFYANAVSNMCVKCPFPCLTCHHPGSSTSCDTCLTGYYLDGSGACLACIAHCDACSSATPSQCTTCTVPKYLADGSGACLC